MENSIAVTPIREIEVSERLDSVKREINALTSQANNMALYFITEIGRKLTEAKAMVGHGDWGKWLSEEVNYSQSTAENYMKIYKQYGDQQISLFGNPSNSQSIQNLGYTKLLALMDLPAEERAEFAEANDVENISVAELKRLLAEETKAKEDAIKAKEVSDKIFEEWQGEDTERNHKMAADIEAAQKEAEEKQREIDRLNERIKGYEDQEKEPENDLEVLRVEIETKAKDAAKKEIEKLQKEKDAAIKKAEKLQTDLADADKKAEELAKAKAEEMSKTLIQEKQAAEKRAAELEHKLKVGADNSVIKLNILFTEFQQNFISIKSTLGEVQDKAISDKMRKVISAQLESMAKELA